MNPARLRLFIKPGCPWCDDALDWFAACGIPLPFPPSLR